MHSRHQLRVTHASHDFMAVNDFDARCAALLYVNDLVVTSPNMTWIPEFPTVSEEGVLLRDDGMWGPQEFSRWPQTNSQSNPHHCAIPLNGSSVVHVDAIAWRDFVPSDWVIEEGQFGDDAYGSLAPGIIDGLSQTLERTYTRLSKEKTSSTGFFALVERLTLQGRNTITRLRELRLPQARTMIEYRDIQRVILELAGVETYIKKIMPRLIDATFRADTPLDIRGAFTMEESCAQDFYRLGVPVWYIRPFASITRNTKIFAVVQPIHWSAWLSGFVPRQFKDILFTHVHVKSLRGGAAQLWTDVGMTQLLDLMQKGIAGRGASGFGTKRVHNDQSTGPSSSNSRPSSPSAGPSLATMAKTTTMQVVSSSARGGSNKRPRHNTRLGLGNARDNEAAPRVEESHALVFEIPTGVDGTRDLPPHCPFWASALQQMSPVRNVSRMPQLYNLPPVWLICHTDPQKNARHFFNAIRVRDFCHMLVLKGDHLQDSCFRVNDWRQILLGDYTQGPPAAEGTISTSLANLNMTLPMPQSRPVLDKPPQQLSASKHKRRADRVSVRVLFGTGAGANGCNGFPPFSLNLETVWRGRKVSVGSINNDKDLRREVLWDYNESLFRCQLWTLETMLVPRTKLQESERRDRERSIQSIFGGFDSDGRMSIFPDLTRPIAEVWVPDRYRRRILHIRNVFMRWPDFPQDIMDFDYERAADQEVETVLKRLIRFYIETFIRAFEHLPAVPCEVPLSLRYL